MATADDLSGARRSAPESRERTAIPSWLVTAGAASWRILAVGAVVYFGFLTVTYLHVVVVPLLLGLFLAALLEPLVARLERFMPRGLACFAALLVAIALFGGAMVFLGVRVADQVSDARGLIDRGWNQVVALIQSSPIDVSDGRLGSFVSSVSEQLQSQLGAIASRVATGARTLFVVASEILLTLAFTFFMLRDGRSLFRNVTDRLDARREHQARRAGKRAWDTLGRYLRGLALVALANSLEKGLALILIGIPMVVPIMVLTFIGSFIPFAGPVIAGAVAALVALAHSGLTDALLIVAAAFLIQIIEGNVLSPFILGKAMRMQPLVILASVAAGAVVAGLVGAFLAVPVLAAVRSAVVAATGDQSDARAASSDG